MSDNGNSGAFFTGFVIGGLVGAAASLLMTPQSGEKTRTQLLERGIELRTQLDEIQQRGKSLVEERRQASLAVEVPPGEAEEEADDTAA